MNDRKSEQSPPVFVGEKEILERCQNLVLEDLTADELRDHFQNLTHSYGKLLRQTGKITKIGDSIQRRLFNARKEIESKNQSLVAAQKKLVLKEKMLGLHVLVSGIAHELRNPLNFINNLSLVHTEIVQDLQQRFSKGDSLDEAGIAEVIDDLSQLAEGADLVHQHGMRAENIIEQMQRITRDPSRPYATDINLLLLGYLERVQNSHAESCPLPGLKIIKEIDPDVGEIVIEAGHVGFVFAQIFANALEAMQERFLQEPDYLPILGLQSKRQAQKVAIHFRDNGPGIPVEHKNEIFSPFFTTKPTGRGNIGLGLFTSYDIVHSYGGEITHGRTSDGFTEFCVSLPCYQEDP